MRDIEENASLQEVAVIDQELGIQYCADSREVYLSMIDIYVEQVDKYMTEMPAYMEQNDWKNFAVTVHGLKSTSLTLGAQAFSEKAKEMEMAAKAEDAAFIRGRYNAFIEEYQCVVAAMKAIKEKEK